MSTPRGIETAWLIETIVQPTSYYCGPGDWCSNPSHAMRFERADAVETVELLDLFGQFRVVEHGWMTFDAPALVGK